MTRRYSRWVRVSGDAHDRRLRDADAAPAGGRVPRAVPLRAARSAARTYVFALVMLGIAYFLHAQGVAGRAFLILYCILITGELLVGLFKWVMPVGRRTVARRPRAAAFAAFIGWIEYRAFQNGGGLDPIFIFIGLFMLFGAINRFKSYAVLRRLFAERPEPEHIAWFDDLVHEIRASDPQSDQLALDLPTSPHWKAKLLGDDCVLRFPEGEHGARRGTGGFRDPSREGGPQNRPAEGAASHPRDAIARVRNHRRHLDELPKVARRQSTSTTPTRGDEWPS